MKTQKKISIPQVIWMQNKKRNRCILYQYEKCNYCGYCAEHGFLDIPLDEPSEDKLLEQLYYELEREADRM